MIREVFKTPKNHESSTKSRLFITRNQNTNSLSRILNDLNKLDRKIKSSITVCEHKQFK